MTTTQNHLNSLNSLLVDAERDLESVEDQLRRALASVTQRCNSALADLDGGFHVNELGVLQSSAVEVDRLCALRETAVRTVSRLRHVVAQVA